MNSQERREKKRREQRRRTSPYSGFSKEQILLINEVRESPLWTEEQKKVPEDLVNDKGFQKKQFDQIIKIVETMEKELVSDTAKEADCGCNKNKETKESSLATDFVADVLKTDSQSDCDCRKKKVCYLGVGIGVLILGVMIWYVFIKKSKIN